MTYTAEPATHACAVCEGAGIYRYGCGLCSGTGEGQYDGSRCSSCRGSGERPAECGDCTDGTVFESCSDCECDGDDIAGGVLYRDDDTGRLYCAECRDAGTSQRDGARMCSECAEDAPKLSECGHSACVQHFIDTGDTSCVQDD